MEKSLNDSVPNLVNIKEEHNAGKMLATDSLALEQESLIENGILQDYLDVFGSMEDN